LLISVGTTKGNGATKERRTESEVTSETKSYYINLQWRNVPIDATSLVLLHAVGESEGFGEAEELWAKSGVAGEAGGAVARPGPTDAANVSGRECVDPRQSEQSKRAILNSEESL
jgi:hypothetical protein